MNIQVLATGSTGNCYILRSGENSLLLELGINYKKMLKGSHFNLPKTAIVSHLHGDHSRFIAEFMNHGGEVFALDSVFCTYNLENHAKANVIKHGDTFAIEGFQVACFEVQHSVENLCFLIADEDDILFFFTDTSGMWYRPKGVTKMLAECNYSMETLDYEANDQHLNSTQEHMSLEDLVLFFKDADMSECEEIILIHGSQTNGDSELFKNTVEKETGIVTKIALKNGGLD